MNELFRVIRRNNLTIFDLAFSDWAAGRATAAGNDDLFRLGCSFHRVEDDILLQHRVPAERGGTRLKDMQSPQRHRFQKVLPKRFEVWAVAKTARRDGNQL